MDAYGASGIPLLFIVFFGVVGFAWGMGAQTVYKALHEMIGFRPSCFWGFAWQYTAPAICAVPLHLLLPPFCPVLLLLLVSVLLESLFVFVVAGYEPLAYASGAAYPGWAEALGLCMCAVSMLAIPAYAVAFLARSPEPTCLAAVPSPILPLFLLPKALAGLTAPVGPPPRPHPPLRRPLRRRRRRRRPRSSRPVRRPPCGHFIGHLLPHCSPKFALLCLAIFVAFAGIILLR